MLRRLLALVLATAAVACGYVAMRGDESGRATKGRALQTPVWSPRRVPEPIVDAVGAQRLQSDVNAQLAATPSCLVVNDGAGVVAARNPDQPMIPASTQKLLTAAATLHTLGPDFRYETKVVAQGSPRSGTVDRLWFVGAGDPVLATPEFTAALQDADPYYRGAAVVQTPLATLADSIVAAGVHSIPGGIQGDDSHYSDERYLPVWKDSYRTDGQIGPLGALTVNHGYRALKPRPTPVDDPAVFAASELGRLLRDRGVSVGGQPGRSQAPADAAPVATIQSPPLRDLVGSFLRSSDNLAGELFTRELGVRVAGQGTTEAGTKVIADKLRELGVPTRGLTLQDGSGLARGDQVPCSTLLGALALGTRPELAPLRDGLSVAGQNGTLIARLVGSPLQGHLRGKTGTLDGVTALVAFVELGRPVDFAFVANGSFSENDGYALADRVAEAVARFPQAPTADQLVPSPVAVAGNPRRG